MTGPLAMTQVADQAAACAQVASGDTRRVFLTVAAVAEAAVEVEAREGATLIERLIREALRYNERAAEKHDRGDTEAWAMNLNASSGILAKAAGLIDVLAPHLGVAVARPKAAAP